MKVKRFVKFLTISLVFLSPAWSQLSGSCQDVKLVRSISLRGTTYHVQGIDTDGDRLWVTSVDSENQKGFLQQFSSASGDREMIVEIQDGARFHPGGIALDEQSLW